MKEHGIESINFNESKASNEEQQEQGIFNIATVKWEDGKITNAYDLVFSAWIKTTVFDGNEKFNGEYFGSMIICVETRFLPN